MEMNSGIYHENIKNTKNSIYSINFNTDTIKKKTIINPYTFYDPTLPKATGIKCPNKKHGWPKSWSNLNFIW